MPPQTPENPSPLATNINPIPPNATPPLLHRHWPKILLIILGSIILIAATAFALWKVGIIKTDSFSLDLSGTESTTTPATSKTYTAEELGTRLAITAEEYSQLLQNFKFETSLENNRLEIYTPALPNLAFKPNFKSNIFLTPQIIKDWSGKTYQTKYAKEGVWSEIELYLDKSAPEGLSGTEWLSPIEELSDGSQIASLTGTLTLKLPLNIEEIILRPNETGTIKEVNGIKVKLNYLATDPQDKTKIVAVYTIIGDKDKVSGNVLLNGNSPIGRFVSQVRTEEEAEFIYTLTYSVKNDETVNDLGLKIYLAKDYEQREYPFEVKNSLPQPTNATATAKSTNKPSPLPNNPVEKTEKDKIISAILYRQQIFATNDVNKIRSFLLEEMKQTEEDVRNLSDEEVLEMAEMMSIFEVTEDQLRSPTTIWQIDEDEATATVYEEGAEISANSVKINGVWR